MINENYNIAHLSDIHIRKNPIRNDEYQEVFNELYDSLKRYMPKRIIISGDLVHDYLDLQGEQLLMACDFLNSLAKIAPLRITRGNHDYLKQNSKRVDSVEAIIQILNNPNIIYYNKTGFYTDENIVWCVWHHGERNNNPWATKTGKNLKLDANKTYIDLFHDPINGCKAINGFDLVSKSYYKLSEFKGEYLFAGDIHLMQYLNKDKTKAYCGSLIAQDFSEGDDNFHGYLLWDIKNKTVDEVSINNNYSFKNIEISPYIDFDDLDFEIESPTKHMKIKFIWKTLPQSRTKETERKLTEYLYREYNDNNIKITNKNDFIESTKIQINKDITLLNITDIAIQQKIIVDHLKRIGTEERVIDDIIKLDKEIHNSINIEIDSGVEWDIIKFGVENFVSYRKFDIDWRNMSGLFQIIGQNTGGKTTIFRAIPYILFGETPETESRVKFGDLRYVNNRIDVNYCSGYAVIEGNGEYFGIKRRTDVKKNKNNEVTAVSTTLNYYLLSSPDDEMTENNNTTCLDEKRKKITENKIEMIIGTYSNFVRIAMTNADNLNNILKTNDMATFIDSILYDSGLDIFDKKVKAFKSYQKKENEKSRIVCNVMDTNMKNDELNDEINRLTVEGNGIEENELVQLSNEINENQVNVEGLIKKLHNIDPEIMNLNINDVDFDINEHKNSIVGLKSDSNRINLEISKLKDFYDANKLTHLLAKKDTHKNTEYELKLNIKKIEADKLINEHAIEIFNGNIFRLKESGAALKKEILNLKNNHDKCPKCGQVLGKDHQHIVDDTIHEIEIRMFNVAKEINETEQNKKQKHQLNIINCNTEITNIKNNIEKLSIETTEILGEIGILTNDKNDVEKRSQLLNQLNQIPIQIQNKELMIDLLSQKKNNYHTNLNFIQENKINEKKIQDVKLDITKLQSIETQLKEKLVTIRNNIINNKNAININNKLIKDFKDQEYMDMVMQIYGKCIHRDGIPTDMLSNYIIPQINSILSKELSLSLFTIYFNADDLRPKLVYGDRPNAIIDCLGACGKERTFSSIAIKSALNQINVKSKPNLFILDEVMGKLLDDSIEEFAQLMQLIKRNVNKILFVEHRANLEADHIIEATLDENGISSLELS